VLMWSTFGLVYVFVPRWRATIGTPLPTRENWPAVLCFALASTSFVNALVRGQVATVLVIISSTPFIAAVAGRCCFRERIGRAMWLAALAGISGVAVATGGAVRGQQMTVNLWAIATAVSMASALLCSSRIRGGTCGLPSLGAAVASLIVLASGEASWPEINLSPSLTPSLTPMALDLRKLWMAFEGGIVMPAALGLLTLSTRYVPASNAGLFLLLETALAPLWIWSVFGEQPAPHAIAGGLLIVGAVLVHFLYTHRESQRRAMSEVLSR
jgi:drug/metabolite transporter (DMT)-like permease